MAIELIICLLLSYIKRNSNYTVIYLHIAPRFSTFLEFTATVFGERLFMTLEMRKAETELTVLPCDIKCVHQIIFFFYKNALKIF